MHAGFPSLFDAHGNIVGARMESFVDGNVYGGALYTELVPNELLEANARYTIRVTHEDGSNAAVERSFTTGDWVLEEAELPVPDVRMGIVSAPLGDTCSNTKDYQGCAGARGEGLLELTTVWQPGSVASVKAFRRNAAPLWFALQGSIDGFCVEARVRDAAGRRGPPATVCASSDDIEQRDLEGLVDDAVGQLICSSTHGLFAEVLDRDVPADLEPAQTDPGSADAGGTAAASDQAGPSSQTSASCALAPRGRPHGLAPALLAALLLLLRRRQGRGSVG